MLVDLAWVSGQLTSPRLSEHELSLLTAWATEAASQGFSYVEVIDWHIDGGDGRDLIRIIDADSPAPIVIYRPPHGQRFVVMQPSNPPMSCGAFASLRQALNMVCPVLPDCAA